MWPAFEPYVVPMLGEEDDPQLWAAVVNAVYADAQLLCRAVPSGQRVFSQLGRCSHWLRPHQSRWAADGGFAAPIGYGGTGFSLEGLPEYDWRVQCQWSPSDEQWLPCADRRESRQFLFRVTVPSRSRRHRRAAVHTAWLPNAPVGPWLDCPQFYGFRREADCWRWTAYWSPRTRPYELAAELASTKSMDNEESTV